MALLCQRRRRGQLRQCLCDGHKLGSGPDYATVRYNASGEEKWVARYNGPGNGEDYAYAVAADDSGDVYVTEDSTGSDSGADYATIKYDSMGQEQWAIRYNGPHNGRDVATALAVDSSGNVYVTGSSDSVTGSDYATIKDLAPLALTSAVSQKAHGATGSFDVNLPLAGAPGIECRTGNGSGDHTLVVTFSNTVISGNAAVTSGTGSVAGSPTFSNNTMAVNLTGVANAQTVTVTLSNVTDSLSRVLSDTMVSASFLLGDTNSDGFVNAGDALQTRNRSGQATDTANFRSDVNADGFVNSGDATVVRAGSGTSLP